MDNFSWMDSFYAAFHTCFPCLMYTAPAHHDDPAFEGHDTNNHAARTAHARSHQHYDELEGLLADTDHSDVDAETLSLHSNINSSDVSPHRNRRRRRKRRRNITFCGLNLFGGSAIRPSDPDDEGDYEDRPLGRSTRNERPQLSIGHLTPAHSSITSMSSYAFDSDASPLDPAAIAKLTAQDAEEAARRAMSEDRRRAAEREKDERCKRGKGREQAQVDGAYASEADASDFGPFITGSEYPQAQRTLCIHQDTGDSQTFARNAEDTDDHDIHDEADFGGGSYVRSSRRNAGGSNGSCSHSNSRSATSASRSNPDNMSHNHNPNKPQVATHAANPAPFPGKVHSSSKKWHLSGAQSTAGTTNLSASPLSQNSSLRTLPGSPTSDPYVSSVQIVSNAPSAHTPSLSSQEITAAPPEFEGFPFDQDFMQKVPSASETEDRRSRFPSVGFAGVRRANSFGANGANGVFLARRGDD